MRQKLSYMIVIITPIIVGLLFGALFETDVLENNLHIASYTVDTAWVVSSAGVLFSLCIAMAIAGRWFLQRGINTMREAEQINQTRKQREFIRRLDHELKNPLTIIQLGLLNLEETMPDTEASRVSLNRINQQSKRLQDLIKHLRQLSDLETFSIDHQPCDIALIIQESVDAIEVLKQNRNIQVYMQRVPWKLNSIQGDRDLIALAIINILDNAIKFTPDNGSIEIRATDDGNQINIEVADNGIGITDDALPFVFEELYRAPNAKPIQGSGLGLSLVKAIMRLHHGQVSIRSKSKQGTVVTLQFRL